MGGVVVSMGTSENIVMRCFRGVFWLFARKSPDAPGQVRAFSPSLLLSLNGKCTPEIGLGVESFCSGFLRFFRARVRVEDLLCLSGCQRQQQSAVGERETRPVLLGGFSHEFEILGRQTNIYLGGSFRVLHVVFPGSPIRKSE